MRREKQKNSTSGNSVVNSKSGSEGAFSRGVTTQCVVVSVILIVALVIMPVLYQFMPKEGMEMQTPVIPLAMSQEEHDRLSKLVNDHEKKILELETIITNQQNQINQFTNQQPQSQSQSQSQSQTRKQQQNDNVEKKRSNVKESAESIPSDILSSQAGLALTDINGNEVIYADSGIIYGNPLLIDVCSNALLSDHELTVLRDLSSKHGTIPLFWSRESIGAALHNQAWYQETASLSNEFNSKDGSIYIDTQNNDLTNYNNVHMMKPNEKIDTNCGITFVDNPIIRFVAEYYAMNGLMFESKENEKEFEIFKNGTFTFWDIHGEPQRFRAFVDDVTRYHYKFMKSHFALSRLSTQSGLLAISQIDSIKFIGRLSHWKQHLQVLKEYCPTSNVLLSDMENVFDDMNNIFGVAKHESLTNEYREMMSLPTIDASDPNSNGIPHVLPAFRAMDYDTWHKIVDYSWQDFVCFDYKADYSFVQKIVAKSS